MEFIRKRNLVIAVCALILAAGLGVIARRKYVQWRHFRKAPRETESRPVVLTPGSDSGTAQHSFALQDEPMEGEASPSRRGELTIIRPRLSPRADGVIVWEAEWANGITGSYECLPAKDTGGGFALWSRQGSGRSQQMHYHRPHRRDGDLGTAEYWFTLAEPGKYRLYMRIRAPDHCGNSCWVGMDRRRRLHCFPDGFDSDFDGRRLHWPEKMFRRWLWLEDAGRLFALEAGRHFLRVEVREDGMAIDQVALVPDGADEPSGVQQPTMIPRGPNDVVPVCLAVNHQCLPRSGEATAHGHLWFRSNSATGLPLVVRLAAGDAKIGPATEVRCELGPDAPFAYLPVSVTLGEPARLEVVELTATASTPCYGGMQVSAAPCRIERPFEWWALGPLDPPADALSGRILMAAETIDFRKAPIAGRPELTWREVESPAHFGHLGTIDLVKVFGLHENCTAYLATVIEVEEAGSYRVTAAGDDTLALQCDGANVVRHEYERTITDTLRPVELKLSAGKHLLVVRVGQRAGAWQMLVRFEGRDGSVAQGITGVIRLGRKIKAKD